MDTYVLLHKFNQLKSRIILEIVEIYENWLYSIQFDEEDLNEYVRVFKEWHDLDYLEKFFTDNAVHIDTPF